MLVWQPHFAAGYYDKYLGTFVSADTLIPDPTDVSSYHRYMYAAGDPIKYNDPTGHDPLDNKWRLDYKKAEPHEVLERLYSLAFPDKYAQIDFSTTTIEKVLEDAKAGTSWDDIPASLVRLAAYYEPGEEDLYTRDIGTLYGGLLNRLEEPDAFNAITYADNPARKGLHVRGGLPFELTGEDGTGNLHHWAWAVAIGGSWMQPAGEILNSAREYHQLAPHQRRSPGVSFYSDIIMGNAGVGFGRHMLLYGLTDIEGVFHGSINTVRAQVDYLRSWFE